MPRARAHYQESESSDLPLRHDTKVYGNRNRRSMPRGTPRARDNRVPGTEKKDIA